MGIHFGLIDMTPLEAVLLIFLLTAVFVIIALFSANKTNEKARAVRGIIVHDSGKRLGYRAFMSDRECQKEFEDHKPTVSGAVMNKLRSIQKQYVEAEGIEKFQNCAGVTTEQGYSIRYRVKNGENYRIVCHSYNIHGKFYSTQDTGNPHAGLIEVEPDSYKL